MVTRRYKKGQGDNIKGDCPLWEKGRGDTHPLGCPSLPGVPPPEKQLITCPHGGREFIIPEQVSAPQEKKEFNPSKRICCGVPMRQVEFRPGHFGYKCDECLTLMEEK